MNHYVGLDISLKEVSICVMDAGGEILNRASVSNTLCIKVGYWPPS
ncbi:transposase [Ruegeria sp. TrichCH4B]|nr:transposase [Ruegeria sp. TrichCH4B]